MDSSSCNSVTNKLSPLLQPLCQSSVGQAFLMSLLLLSHITGRECSKNRGCLLNIFRRLSTWTTRIKFIPMMYRSFCDPIPRPLQLQLSLPPHVTHQVHRLCLCLSIFPPSEIHPSFNQVNLLLPSF